MGGHETTSSLLSWVLFMIFTHPEVERKLKKVNASLFVISPGIRKL
jgi:cytochrome P450